MKNMKDIGLSKYSMTKCGKVFSLKSGRFLKLKQDPHGYIHTSLSDDSDVIKTRKIHRLVATLFLDNPTNLPCVNHKDGDKSNNSVDNLEWCTYSHNNTHANQTGLRNPTYLTKSNRVLTESQVVHDWEVKGLTPKTEDDVHNVCRLLEDGYRACDVSSMTGYDRRAIQHIRDNTRDKWRHIVSEYDFSRISRKEKTSPDRVLQICQMLESGLRPSDVVRELNCDRKLVENIKNRKFHTKISSCFEF